MADLYGPVWITTSLVLVLFIGSSSAEFLRNAVRLREVLRHALPSTEIHRLWRASEILMTYLVRAVADLTHAGVGTALV